MCYRCNWSLKSISKAAGDIYELSYSTPDGDRTLRAKSVALTAPSYVVADLLKNVAPKASDVLRTIDYPPVCAVTIAYPESDIKVRLNPAFQVIQSYHTAGNTSVNLHPRLHVIKMRFSLPPPACSTLHACLHPCLPVIASPAWCAWGQGLGLGRLNDSDQAVQLTPVCAAVSGLCSHLLDRTHRLRVCRTSARQQTAASPALASCTRAPRA